MPCASMNTFPEAKNMKLNTPLTISAVTTVTALRFEHLVSDGD
jgi:hypothetical protein